MEKIRTYSIMIVIASILFSTYDVNAQNFNKLDNNPHDIVYYRPNGETNAPQVKVIYGRPDAVDEVVFGTQIPYNKIWVTGSDETTELKFYCDVMFGNKYVKAGTYVMYTIPNENYWTIILNSKTDTYGAFFYNPKFDVAKIEVPASKGKMVENFSIAFVTKNYGPQMVLAWAKTRVKIPLYTEESLISKI
jgi:DUF2911 family protein